MQAPFRDRGERTTDSPVLKILQAGHLILMQDGLALLWRVISYWGYVYAIMEAAMNPRKPKTDQERLPKKRRSKSPPRFNVTERDIEFVRAMLEYRCLRRSGGSGSSR